MKQFSGTSDGPLVSPVESSSGYWGHQGHSSSNQTSISYAPPARQDERLGHSQAQAFGGPSDWELYDPGAPPEQTPTSPPKLPSHNVFNGERPISPPESQAPTQIVVRPVHPVEIGAPSPVSTRKDSQIPPPPSQISQPPPKSQPVDERQSSVGQDRETVSVHRDSTNGTGNIDSVIQAWTKPLKVRSGQESSERPESRASARVASPEISPTVQVVDPYADLEPEFKASLKRYAAMLRKESSAETDEEKFSIFQTFVTKELRLRSLLYGVELQKETKEVKKAASLAEIQAVLPKSGISTDVSEKADQLRRVMNLSAGEPSQQPPAPPATKPESHVMPPVNPTVNEKDAPKLDTTKPVNVAPSEPPGLSIHPVARETPESTDQPSVVAPTTIQEEAYSPGGRPMISKATPTPTAQPSLEAVPQYRPRSPFPESLPSPSNDAPMVIEDYATIDPISPSINAPILVVPETPRDSEAFPGRPSPVNKPVVPIKFEPPRPAYTPFRYNSGVEEEKKKPLQPADRAYSTLRSSVADSGRFMAQEAVLAPVRPSSSSGRKEHEEAFIGLIRKQSMAVRQKARAPPGAVRPGGNSPRPEPPVVMRVGTPAMVKPVDPLKDAVTALRSLLPQDPSVSASEYPKLKTVKSKVEVVADQFGFIKETVLEWDRTNREVRKQQDAERQARQEESEAHIDGLFNDNEIGYADIGELEAEFKLSEAERRYQENQEELESFTAQVFTPVTERLQKEISELTTAYTMAIDLLDLESEPVTGCFKGNNERARMSEVMTLVLTLFNKIEIRHRKVAEAHVERERRRKHLELTVLYTNGDTAGVKALEKEFAIAEKMQVLHEARGKDSRANRLMDSFDRATVRGLGDNQMFVDDVLPKLQELKTAMLAVEGDVAKKEKLFEQDGPRDTLALAQDVMDTVMADSRQLLGLSNEADILLNDADYGVSVAEARVANAEPTTYANLDKEKAKEDAKLIEEMNARISSVTKGPQDAITLARETIDRIGADPEHQERIKKALEAAKQRNASIDGG